MLKEFAWRTFEKTGSISAYLFYKEMAAEESKEKVREITEEEVAISK